MAAHVQRRDQILKSRTIPESLRPIDFYKSLLISKGREEHGLFLIEGSRAVSQIVASAPQQIDELLTINETKDSINGTLRHRVITEKQLRVMAWSQNPAGPLAVVRIPQEPRDTLPSGIDGNVLLCEHIQDPGNVGTLIRTAAAFGFSGIILSDKCADPYSPKAVQAAAGSTLSLWIRRTAAYLDLTAQLRKQEFVLAAADLRGTVTLRCAGRGKRILALGNEGSGLTEALLAMADTRFCIPIHHHRVESLNVAACGAICMYELSQ